MERVQLLVGGGTGNGCLAQTSGTQPKRLYTLGQYSRFIRPGLSRVDAVATHLRVPVRLQEPRREPNRDGGDHCGTSEVPLALTIDAGSFGALTSHRTSASETSPTSAR